MFTKFLVPALSFALYFSPILAVADDTKMCNKSQNAKCERFCQGHSGMKSCIIDMTTRSGTCSCEDGTSHSR